MEKWNVYSLDVWGNEEDGYEVNDRSRIGTVELPKAFSDEWLLKTLKNEGLINYKKSDIKSIEIDGGEDWISIDYKGKPFFSLDKA